MSLLRTATDWLAPFRTVLPELTTEDWKAVDRLQELLSDLLSELLSDLPGQASTGTGDRATRSAGLLRLRRELARHGFAMRCSSTADRGGGRPAAFQAVAQFVCGFHDTDLRDATGPGHGILATRLAPTPNRDRWLERLRAGALVGIALTERRGGSRVREHSTTARRLGPHTWELYGEKAHVSRLYEADGFVVFFNDPYGGVCAALLESDRPGLAREELEPVGLRGWSWGILRLHGVRLDPRTDLIGEVGSGHALREWHFTRYRPLVAATVAGTAAGVHSEVSSTLAARQRIGLLERVRDHALGALGRAYPRIVSGLLLGIVATRLADEGRQDAALWAKLGKASGVQDALCAVRELEPLVGARSYRADGRLAKAQADLAGFQFADGLNDELYRSGGKALLGRHRPAGP